MHLLVGLSFGGKKTMQVKKKLEREQALLVPLEELIMTQLHFITANYMKDSGLLKRLNM